MFPACRQTNDKLTKGARFARREYGGFLSFFNVKKAFIPSFGPHGDYDRSRMFTKATIEYNSQWLCLQTGMHRRRLAFTIAESSGIQHLTSNEWTAWACRTGRSHCRPTPTIFPLGLRPGWCQGSPLAHRRVWRDGSTGRRVRISVISVISISDTYNRLTTVGHFVFFWAS